MSLVARLKELRTERKKVLDQAGAILTKAHAEKRDLTGEEKQEFEARHADGVKFKDQADLLQKQVEAEHDLGLPAIDTRSAGREDTARPAATEEQRKAVAITELRVFRRWMANGTAALSAEERSALEGQAVAPDQLSPELRALSAATGTAGAYTIPQGFVYTLDQALKMFGGIVTAADYIDTDQGNVLPYPSVNDTANSGEGPLAENTAAATNQDPAFGVVNYNAYMYDSGIVLIPLQLLQDSAFNPDTYMGEMLKTRLGRKLNAACTTGTGSSQPNGIVTASTLGVTAAAQAAFTNNELLALFHSVDPAYRADPSCAWMFNDSALLAIRKLVDGNGRPLFIAGGTSEGIQNGAPDTIHGKPYVINQDMATPAAGVKSILFGAMKKYKIRRVRQIQMVRFGERYMDKLQIGFLSFQRFDGNLVDAGTHPVKYLQQAP